MNKLKILFIFLLFFEFNNSLLATFGWEESGEKFEIKCFSSETSEGTIGKNILDCMKHAQTRVIIASDQCTNEEFLDELILLRNPEGDQRDLRVEVITGDSDYTHDLLSEDKFSNLDWLGVHRIFSNDGRSGKMHNKFIVLDDHTVITGSPNMTYAAYNYNIESFVQIKNTRLALLYTFYYEYIVSGKDKYDDTQEEYLKVMNAMIDFNQLQSIQVCLAPIRSIKNFIVEKLGDASLLSINMFLVSRAQDQQKNDIIQAIIDKALAGVPVTLKVDAMQYKQFRFMREAIKPLEKIETANAFIVQKKPQTWITKENKKIKTKPQFHDKLILIGKENDEKQIFIGSAGFSTNVQGNLNLENMIFINNIEAYNFFLGHFESINDSRPDLVIEELKDND